MHRRSIRRAARYANAKGLKLNLGCGPNLKSGWINVDLNRETELQLDLRRDLPFNEGSVSLVYSEHFFEHIDYPGDAMAFLRECYRVLEPLGVMSMAIPDTEWAIRSYLTADPKYYAVANEKNWHGAWCDTPMHHLNYHFRQVGEHKYVYDYETIARVFTGVGYMDVCRREFDPNLDTAERRVGSMYVEARKPGLG
jgi:predicted SAM-dependent methyltransferase